MKTQQTLALALALAAASTFAHADGHDKGMTEHDGSAYAVEGDGDLIVDGGGNCIRVGSWTESGSIDACEGRAKPAPAPAPKPKPIIESIPEPEPDPIVESIPEPEPIPDLPSNFNISNFELDADDMETAASAGKMTRLNELARYLLAVPGSRVRLIGHTDSAGSRAYNQELSEERAEDVAEYLLRRGVAADRIQPSGRGEDAPIASNETKEGRAENRRVEVEILN